MAGLGRFHLRRQYPSLLVRAPPRGRSHRLHGSTFMSLTIPNPLQGESVYSDHGRGIFLINQLMDEVKFLKNGTEIHMIKK